MNSWAEFIGDHEGKWVSLQKSRSNTIIFFLFLLKLFRLRKNLNCIWVNEKKRKETKTEQKIVEIVDTFNIFTYVIKNTVLQYKFLSDWMQNSNLVILSRDKLSYRVCELKRAALVQFSRCVLLLNGWYYFEVRIKVDLDSNEVTILYVITHPFDFFVTMLLLLWHSNHESRIVVF